MLTAQQRRLVVSLAALLLSTIAPGSSQQQHTAHTSHGSVLSPQALYRKSYFTLDPGMLVRKQTAMAVGEHNLPAAFTACSSLEGPACLASTGIHQEGVQSRYNPFTNDGGFQAPGQR